jgi:hypothetical protein
MATRYKRLWYMTIPLLAMTFGNMAYLLFESGLVAFNFKSEGSMYSTMLFCFLAGFATSWLISQPSAVPRNPGLLPSVREEHYRLRARSKTIKGSIALCSPVAAQRKPKRKKLTGIKRSPSIPKSINISFPCLASTARVGCVREPLKNASKRRNRSLMPKYLHCNRFSH